MQIIRSGNIPSTCWNQNVFNLTVTMSGQLFDSYLRYRESNLSVFGDLQETLIFPRLNNIRNYLGDQAVIYIISDRNFVERLIKIPKAQLARIRLLSKLSEEGVASLISSSKLMDVLENPEQIKNNDGGANWS